MRTYKICSPYAPETGGKDVSDRLSSDQAAVDERIDNIRVIPRAELAARLGLPSVAVMRAAVEKLKLWDNGSTLRVRFLDGDPGVQAKVAAIAKEWEAETNLTLEFVHVRAAEIRISFAEKGFSWSTVGTDAKTVPGAEATMNYGWLEPDTELREYQRVVRHEFGHALGMIHEHQNPAAAGVIPWDKPKVYAYYAQQGWSKADVDFNIFQVYSEDSTNHTTFDPTSIMEYAIPDSADDRFLCDRLEYRAIGPGPRLHAEAVPEEFARVCRNSSPTGHRSMRIWRRAARWTPTISSCRHRRHAHHDHPGTQRHRAHPAGTQ